MIRVNPKKLKDYPWFLRLMFRGQKERYGAPLTSSLIWGRIPRLFVAVSSFFQAFNRKGALLDPKLRALVALRVARLNRCPFNEDMYSAIAIASEADADQLQNAIRVESSPKGLSAKEKIALEYSTAITLSDEEVSDALFQKLKGHFNDDAIVELTGFIALQNGTTKFNTALQIPSQHFYRVGSP